MTSEWDGTSWGGSPVVMEPDKPAQRGIATIVAKAATGWQGIYTPYNTVVSSSGRSPLKTMREAQALYWTNPWIGSAEDAVTRKVSGLPFHIEDQNDDTVDDEERNPALKAIVSLLEKPQANLPEDERQAGYETWTDMIAVTSRHMGVCGLGYWFLDSVDRFGIPAAILYVNPGRLFPLTTKLGRLLGYVLDPMDDQGHGGTPIRRDQILPFYLRPPDFGSLPKGLVERAALKAGLTSMADRHAVDILASGGRIAGLISPKEGYIDDPDRWKQLEMDIRSVTDAPDAARRAAIVRGPVEFHDTAANPSELGLLDLSKMNRDDIFAIWGVPPSQGGIPTAGGLNSGETRKYDYQTLMQGPVHDRVNVIRSTVQLKLLDRWNVTGLQPQLVIEEPDFDDNAVPYELASKAKDQPLTNNERREIINLDPLPDYGPDGEPLGLAIMLPFNLSAFGQGPEEDAPDGNPFPKAKPVEVKVTPIQPPQLGAGSSSPVPAAAKASPERGFLALRRTLDTKVIPSVQKTLQAVLTAQRASVVAKVKARGASLAKKPATVWDEPGEDTRLSKAMRPHLTMIAETVTARSRTLLAAKADPFSDGVEDELIARTGKRIVGINATTRDAVVEAIREGFAAGLTVQEIADRIEVLPAFDEARAEMVARTESGYAYNYAAVASYREYGVESVEVIDGDQDDICAEVAGTTQTLDWANENALGHPNCTRDFAPLVLAAKAEVFDPGRLVIEAIRAMPAPVNHFYPPEVHVSSPDVRVDVRPTKVNVDATQEPRTVRKSIVRDERGQITAIVEES